MQRGVGASMSAVIVPEFQKTILSGTIFLAVDVHFKQ